MICSDNSICKKFDLIEVDGMFICKSCNTIFDKPFKIVINCCRKKFINRRSNIPYRKNCKKNCLCVNDFVTNHQPTVTAHIFSTNNTHYLTKATK